MVDVIQSVDNEESPPDTYTLDIHTVAYKFIGTFIYIQRVHIHIRTYVNTYTVCIHTYVRMELGS